MYALQTVKQLIKRGCSTDLLCYPDSRLCKEAFGAEITSYQIRFESYLNPFRIIELRNLLLKNRYDLIHTDATRDLWIIVPALKLAGLNIPLLFTKHIGSSVIKKDPIHKWLYGRVDLGLAISSVIKNNLSETTPLGEDRILLLHDAIDTELFNPDKTDHQKIRNEFRINKDELVIGMTARFSPGKGHEEFLLAARKIASSFNNVKFLVVGEPSRGEEEYAGRIKNLAAELKITDKLIFTGFRKDIPQILAALDIFVFPSHAEAFGLALVEAMSMKLPSVCSNSDGVLDIAVDGETSLLFEKKNHAEIADKVIALINDPGKRIAFGENARRRVLEKFDFDVFTEKMINIFEKQIARSENN